MGDARQLEILAKGADAWNAWIKPRVIPDLSGADLSRANLRGADLSRANLRGADLSRANLREANLRGADLREANLCAFR